MAALVASQPLETWKDYLRVRALDEFADVLPTEFARQASAFRNSTAAAEAQQTSRARARPT
jgi:Peptidase family M13.